MRQEIMIFIVYPILIVIFYTLFAFALIWWFIWECINKIAYFRLYVWSVFNKKSDYADSKEK